jgi:hypothetical protein
MQIRSHALAPEQQPPHLYAVLASQSGPTAEPFRGRPPLSMTLRTMLFTFKIRWVFAIIIGIALMTFSCNEIMAQSGNGKPPEPSKTAPDAKKESEKKIDEIAEASRLLTGPAGQPECVWLGHRVVTLMWRDDLDTAFRHLDLYDRFGCPGAHVQATFRCLVRQENIDPKVQETLIKRVHDCWLDPGLPPTSDTPGAATTSTGTTPH